MRLATRFTALLTTVFASLTVCLFLLQVHWVDKLLIGQATSRMAQEIQAAWQILHDEQHRLEMAAAFVVDCPEFMENAAEDMGGLEPLLADFSSRWQLDVLALLGPDQAVKVLAGGQPGRTLSIPGLVSPIPADSRQSGFMLLPADRARTGTGAAASGGDDLMVLFALHPIMAEGEVKGALYAAVVLNDNEALVDRIQGALFGNAVYAGKRQGTTTIFQGPRRVATTVLLGDGSRALGTLVSDEVAARTLGQGRPWAGRAKVVSDWYLSHYAPIRDPSGAVIGMLYIGELEEVYLDIKRETLLASMSAILAIMVAAFFINYRITRKTVKQIASLDKATLQFTRGDTSARVHIRTRDEVGELAESFNRMAESISEDHSEILAQKEQIERINRNYMEMLGFATHELRTTLSSALLNAHLLKDGSYDPLTEDQAEGVGLIIDSLSYLEDLTNNYLQLSRIEKGELVVNKTGVNVAREILAPVVDGFLPQIRNKDMNVEVLVAEDLEAPVDPNLIRVVYENLVGNAIKYGRTGGAIKLEAEEGEGEIILSVWNEGKGLPADQASALFRKFQRYDIDEATGRKGTGLGLFIVEQIVAVHGGRIWAESEEGVGTRFSFTLPT